MPLPPPAPGRRLRHHRRLDVEVHERTDGLWEVDATLRDVKTGEVRLGGVPRAAGEPIHEMLLRLVVDTQGTIVAAGSQTLWMPYPGTCDEHGDAYAALIGLNLLRNFRLGLRERVGGVRGCTHLTELAQVLPTALVQAFAGLVIDTRGEAEGARRPFQIDRCHALRHDGDVVRVHYPRWYGVPPTPPEVAADAADRRDPPL